MILFDLDGTLLDTSHDIHTAVNLLLQQENKPQVAYIDLRPRIGLGAKKILEYVLNLDYERDQQAKVYIDTLIPKLLEFYRDTKYAKTFPFDGIKELLDDLESQRRSWGIVTNRLHAFTLPILESVGLLHRSACVVSGDTTPFTKPHPEPLLHACKILQVNPEKCIYIGDAETDVQAGKAAGMATIAVSFGYIDQSETAINSWQADYIAHSAQEINSWIQKWSSREI
jgi:N-acetyl-D-muramate 6-phosphate phosphatase